MAHRKERKMPTITLSIHGGKHCRDGCLWHTWRDDFGAEDGHMWMNSDRMVIAHVECGHVVGAWKYDKGNRTIHSLGTWVAPKYRKHGIAKKMWEFGINYEKPREMRVVVISDRGYSLVGSMAEQFPKIKWKIEEESDRKLRKLKK